MALHRDSTEQVGRLAGLLACLGVGATLTIVVAAIHCPGVGHLASTAIVSVATITAGALAVLGVASPFHRS
jgi:hypothetical protein